VLRGKIEVDAHKIKQKRNRSGKVIRFFTVEIAASGSDPALDSNPSNPYTQLSEEERLKDFIEMFGILWAESCQEVPQKSYTEKNIKK
jgi:hypothetical protein